MSAEDVQSMEVQELKDLVEKRMRNAVMDVEDKKILGTGSGYYGVMLSFLMTHIIFWIMFLK